MDLNLYNIDDDEPASWLVESIPTLKSTRQGACTMLAFHNDSKLL
jgi:hypothetical protein